MQACKNKDLNSSNIDDILSDMLNIDDCDLFDMNDPRQMSGTANDRHNDDFYYDRDSDEDDFEARRTCDHSFHDDEDEVEEEEEDDEEDDDDEDDTEAAKRRNNLLRTQLIIEGASDDNANLHGFDNMKFTNFDLAPWNTAQPAAAFGSQSTDFGATSFFPDEVNFQANFPSSAVTAIFDPVDPFASSFSDSSVPSEAAFNFDTPSAFGDFDAVFGGAAAATTASLKQNPGENVAFDAVFPTVDLPPTQIQTNDKLDAAAEVSVVQSALESQPISNGTVEPVENAKL